MRNATRLLALAGCLSIAAVPGQAGPRDAESPLRFRSTVLDGPPARIVNPLDGAVWAAWSYRNGAEFDVAVSRLDADGFWTPPEFIGTDDGIDQIEPALAADPAGNLYLAYAERQTRRLMLAHRRPADGAWSVPLPPGRERLGRSPELRVVADRLVLAFLEARRIRIADLPLLQPESFGSDFTDGPDPIGAAGDSPEQGSNGSSNGSRNDSGSTTSSLQPLGSTGSSPPPPKSD